MAQKPCQFDKIKGQNPFWMLEYLDVWIPDVWDSTVYQKVKVMWFWSKLIPKFTGLDDKIFEVMFLNIVEYIYFIRPGASTASMKRVLLRLQSKCQEQTQATIMRELLNYPKTK